MVSYAIVKSNDLTHYNRMDAGFYIALQAVEARYQELVATMPVAEVHRRLALLTAKEKAPCFVLARGQRGLSALPAIEKEYPHLAWALIEPTLEVIYAKQAKSLKQLNARLNEIRRWKRPAKGVNT